LDKNIKKQMNILKPVKIIRTPKRFYAVDIPMNRQ